MVGGWAGLEFEVGWKIEADGGRFVLDKFGQHFNTCYMVVLLEGGRPMIKLSRTLRARYNTSLVWRFVDGGDA